MCIIDNTVMMKLIRTGKRPDGIFSVLYDDEGDQIAVTLEHSYDSEPKLPPGTYTCVRGKHALDSHPELFETFEITNVPGHSGILFHWGMEQGQRRLRAPRSAQCDSSEGCMLTNSQTLIPDHSISLLLRS